MRIIRLAASRKLIMFLNRADRNRLVPDPDLINALWLVNNISENNKPANRNTWVKIQTCIGTYTSYVVEIQKLKNIIVSSGGLSAEQSAAVNDVLTPYDDVFNLFPTGTNYTALEIPNKLKHIVTIANSGHSNGTKKIQEPMFSKIYEEYKNIVSRAATSAGNTNLANAIMSQNALLIPDVLFKNARFEKPSMYMSQSAKKTVEKIMNLPYDASTFDKVFRQNVEIVKESIMINSGSGNSKEIYNNQKHREEEERLRMDPSKLKTGIPPSAKSIEEEFPVTVKEDRWINPSTLSYLVSFFMMYYQIVLSLPDE
jgi:hypothetical protein